MDIEYFRNKDINKEKWDEALSLSSNGNIYAHSWYLDTVCPNWSALVADDYQYIMPLTARSRFGFNYLFRPLLSQQLGVYSANVITETELNLFINSIPGKYKLIQYCFNKKNNIPGEWSPREHKSFELSLNGGYEELKSAYSENHKRNLKKALLINNNIVEDIPQNEYLELIIRDDSPGSKILTNKDNFKIFTRLLFILNEKKALKIHGVRNSKKDLISAVMYGYSGGTWYYLAPAGSEDGKTSRSNFLIIDHLIQSRAKSKEILDFEGSDIPNLAKFYSGFGAAPVRYDELYINSLPWPIKYLK